MKLYIVNRVDRLQDVVQFLADDDRLLLIEDGVYGVVQEKYTVILPERIQAQTYCLKDDADARGITPLAHPAVQWVDVNGFMALTEECASSVTWH